MLKNSNTISTKSEKNIYLKSRLTNSSADTAVDKTLYTVYIKLYCRYLHMRINYEKFSASAARLSVAHHMHGR